ncbi:MAG: hypothetical protein AAFX53_10795 [Bacteroidota bacterium]
MIPLIGLIVLFVSCKGQTGVSPATVDQSRDDSLILLLADNYSGSETAETLIIRSSKELRAFFVKVNRTRKPGLPLPLVDFTKETVLVYCSGETKGSLKPILTLGPDSGDKKIVNTKMENKKEDSKIILSPFSMYKIPITQKEIIFQKEIISQKNR